MAYTINDDCVACGGCEPECDVNHAISQGQRAFVIDQTRCTECIGVYETPRCVMCCPVKCIVKNPECEETRGQLLAKWQALHPDRKPAIGTY